MQSFAQACDFRFATLQWFTPVPGLGPELCHDRGLALPHPWDCRLGGLALPHPWNCVGVTVALGVSSVVVPGSGMWQVYMSTPWADIAVNRHQSSISSLES